MGDNILHLEC